MFDFIDEITKISKLIQVGKVVEIDSEGRSLVKVELGDGLETDFIPLLQIANPICAVWISPKVAEQVVVLSPDGEIGKGFALRGIYWKGRREPKESNQDNVVIEFKDGSFIVYDTQSNGLEINSTKDIKLVAEKNNVEIKALKVSVEAEIAEINAKEVNLGDGPVLAGVVTGLHVCSFTGGAHPNASTGVKASL